MRAIHIHVTDRQHRLLREESEVSGLPMAELVRRALDKTYRPRRRLKARGYEIALSVARPPDPKAIGRRDRLI